MERKGNKEENEVPLHMSYDGVFYNPLSAKKNTQVAATAMYSNNFLTC